MAQGRALADIFDDVVIAMCRQPPGAESRGVYALPVLRPGIDASVRYELVMNGTVRWDLTFITPVWPGPFPDTADGRSDWASNSEPQVGPIDRVDNTIPGVYDVARDEDIISRWGGPGWYGNEAGETIHSMGFFFVGVKVPSFFVRTTVTAHDATTVVREWHDTGVQYLVLPIPDDPMYPEPAYPPVCDFYGNDWVSGYRRLFAIAAEEGIQPYMWLTLIVTLLTYLLSPRDTKKDKRKALINAAAAGAITYGVTNYTDWGQENLQPLDDAIASPFIGPPNPEAVSGTNTNGAVTEAKNGFWDTLQSWGPTGVATVVGTTGAVAAANKSPWLWIALIAAGVMILK